MSEKYCVECEVFQQFKTSPNRALVCETARACGECNMMKKLAEVEKLIERWKDWTTGDCEGMIIHDCAKELEEVLEK